MLADYNHKKCQHKPRACLVKEHKREEEESLVSSGTSHESMYMFLSRSLGGQEDKF